MNETPPARRRIGVYKCEDCKAEFEYPLIIDGRNPMPDGFSERFKEVLCPYCGSPYFNEMEDE